MEKIISISEHVKNAAGRKRQEGYLIVTSQQEVFVGMDAKRQCCESFGYFMSEDDLSQFVGSNLISIKIVDTALKVYNIEELSELDEGSVMFVNFETSVGLLQFVAYNNHTGYYGHEAIVESKQLNYLQTL